MAPCTLRFSWDAAAMDTDRPLPRRVRRANDSGSSISRLVESRAARSRPMRSPMACRRRIVRSEVRPQAPRGVIGFGAAKVVARAHCPRRTDVSGSTAQRRRRRSAGAYRRAVLPGAARLRQQAVMIRPANDGIEVYLGVEPVDFRRYALCPVMLSARGSAR